MRTSTFVLRLSAALCGAAALALAQSTCEKLKSLQPADAVFTAVELVPAGPRAGRCRSRRGRVPGGRCSGRRRASGPGGGRGAAGGRGTAAPAMLPAYCHVAATLKPSTDSDIRMELYMPAENWNGKFQMLGNGGWAGSSRASRECSRLCAKATLLLPPIPAIRRGRHVRSRASREDHRLRLSRGA